VLPGQDPSFSVDEAGDDLRATEVDADEEVLVCRGIFADAKLLCAR
jgi:hypothetical protein